MNTMINMQFVNVLCAIHHNWIWHVICSWKLIYLTRKCILNRERKETNQNEQLKIIKTLYISQGGVLVIISFVFKRISAILENKVGTVTHRLYKIHGLPLLTSFYVACRADPLISTLSKIKGCHKENQNCCRRSWALSFWRHPGVTWPPSYLLSSSV